MATKVLVYRFVRKDEHQRLSPKYMAGTMEAIQGLGAEPILETARSIEAKLLEHGFYYEHTPTVVQSIE